MEEMRLVAGQPLVEEGEKTGFFFKLKEGRLRSGAVEYSQGDLVGVVEYFTSTPFRSSITADTDSTVLKISLEDLEDDSLYDEVMVYLLSAMDSVMKGGIDEGVIEELKRMGDIGGIAEVAEDVEMDTALNAIEEMLTFQKLPEIPEDEELALKLLEKVESEQDRMKFALHCIAFSRKFPKSNHTPGVLMKASEVYIDEFGDRYGARYVLKLLFLFQPNSELLKEALKKLIKLLREDRDPEWFEYLERFFLHFPEEEVKMDEIT